MCKILTVVVAFLCVCVCVNSTFLGHDSLPIVLILYGIVFNFHGNHIFMNFVRFLIHDNFEVFICMVFKV